MTATDTVAPNPYGDLIEPATLKLRRLLPGPIERVWDYLTDSDLRRQWFASGEMELKVGAQFELLWRNDELAGPSKRPEGTSESHSLTSEITEVDPPRRLSFLFGQNGEVTFALEPLGDEVMLTLTHRRIPSRDVMRRVSAGWHSHLDLLVHKLAGGPAEPFWDSWRRLMAEYDERLPR